MPLVSEMIGLTARAGATPPGHRHVPPCRCRAGDVALIEVAPFTVNDARRWRRNSRRSRRGWELVPVIVTLVPLPTAPATGAIAADGRRRNRPERSAAPVAAGAANREATVTSTTPAAPAGAVALIGIAPFTGEGGRCRGAEFHRAGTWLNARSR